MFLCVSSRDADPEAQKTQVHKMLHELRIQAVIMLVPWDNITKYLYLVSVVITSLICILSQYSTVPYTVYSTCKIMKSESDPKSCPDP